jgi:glycosyltransferase involved in cell wall biosynthesis
MSSRAKVPATRVLICHERFLFRFGADRVFILIAEKLRALGCHVTLLGARFDPHLLEQAADELVRMPSPRDYHRLDEFCSRWVQSDFERKGSGAAGFDLVIHGGWPLFGATPAFRRMAPRVLFLDHGIVPSAGYPAGQQAIFKLIHDLRRRYLPGCTHAAGVSDFIVESQTRPDVGPGVPVRAILNGADHFGTPATAPAGIVEESVAVVRRLRAEGHPLILNLGRIECGTYKNSQAAVDVLHLVRTAVPNARLLLLEQPANLRPPLEAAEDIVPIGFPSDAALGEIIRLVDVGLSVSLWEGFNLPLVELLRGGTPALALRIGAHGEVVPDPWFLGTDSFELAAKAVTILNDSRAARGRLATEAAAKHWATLTWDRFVREMLEFVGRDPAGA